MKQKNNSSHQELDSKEQRLHTLIEKAVQIETIHFVKDFSIDKLKDPLFDNRQHLKNEFYDSAFSKREYPVLRKVNDLFKIIQFTDLHLMDNEKDEITFLNIRKVIWDEKPDLVVFTGDQTMSIESKMLYEKLGHFMDEFVIPFTYVFGNHDAENGVSYDELNHVISNSRNLYFSAGPKNLGYSNFCIEVRGELNQLEKVLIFMDSHQEDTYLIDGKKVWSYAAITSDQMKWYCNVVKNYTKENSKSTSILFMHIPLPEFKDVKNVTRSSLQGELNEQPSTSLINTGFFELIKTLDHSKAIFCGHDHYNDVHFMKDGILLAYGRVSGQYDYGVQGFPKGFRIIELNRNTDIQTRIKLY
jgi:predicted MPP superfamily phosphohydrolase